METGGAINMVGSPIYHKTLVAMAVFVLLLLPCRAGAGDAQIPSVTVIHNSPPELRRWDIVDVDWSIYVGAPVEDAYLLIKLEPGVYLYQLEVTGENWRCQDVGYEHYACFHDAPQNDAVIHMRIYTENAGNRTPLVHSRFSWLGGPTEDWARSADVYERWQTIPLPANEMYLPMVIGGD